MSEAFLRDPLLPHLLEIIAEPACRNLILAGGFGMRLKQEDLQRRGVRTLMTEVPPARATQDLDFFLRLELFTQKEQGKAIRKVLDGLSYQEKTPQWQFMKPLDPDLSTKQVMVDLLARHPTADESVKVQGRRVGSRSNIGLHGRETPEAFAVEDIPHSIRIAGQKTDGQTVEATVLVPHPYASLNMKVTAAHDWLLRTPEERKRKPNSEKHAFDVYILIAMLAEEELTETKTLAEKYSANTMAQANKQYIEELYGYEDALGMREIRNQANGAEIDHSLFYEVLRTALNA